MMKRILVCVACLLSLFLWTAPLRAETPPAPEPPGALCALEAAIFLPPADPGSNTGPEAHPLPDLLVPPAQPAACTSQQCLSDCTDCPWGCIARCQWATCTCFCSCP